MLRLMESKMANNETAGVTPIRTGQSCWLCHGTGEYREYVCVRCGGYGSFGNDVPNGVKATPEETARWVVERFSGDNKVERLKAFDLTILPLPIVHKDFSFLGDSIKHNKKKIKGIIAGALE